MKAMTILLPESMESFIQARVARSGYSDASNYVRDLILADQEKERIDDLLIDGLQSGPTVEVTPAFWEERKRRPAGTDGQ